MVNISINTYFLNKLRFIYWIFDKSPIYYSMYCILYLWKGIIMNKSKKKSFGQLYSYLFDASRTINQLRKAKKNKLISMQFIERIMLAVTEVNGCEICSYGHTKIALEQGMSEEEIQLLLSGETSSVPKDQLHAIMFAQHYADTEGKPSEAAWEKLVHEYGLERSYGILGATRMIMFGNTYLVPVGNIKDRLTGKENVDSSLINDLIKAISIIVLLPTAVIHTLITKEPLISFNHLAQIQ